MQAVGARKLRAWIMTRALAMRMGRLTVADMRVSSITLESENRKATMQIESRRFGRWQSNPQPLHWIRFERQWYLTDPQFTQGLP